MDNTIMAVQEEQVSNHDAGSCSSSSVVDADGDFLLDLIRGDTDEILDRLRRLRLENIGDDDSTSTSTSTSRTAAAAAAAPQDIRFVVVADEAYYAVADEIIATFEHYSRNTNSNSNSNSKQWNMGAFFYGASASKSFHNIIASALKTRRFRKIHLGSLDDEGGGGEGEASDYHSPTLSMLFRNLSSLEHVALDGFLLSEVTCQVLARGLITPSSWASLTNYGSSTTTTTNNNNAAATTTKKAVLKSLKLKACTIGDSRHYAVDDDDFGIDPAFATVAAGLLGNQTLEVLSIEKQGDNGAGGGGNIMEEDDKLAMLLRGLISHPCLQRLELAGTNMSDGPDTMDALSRVVRTCRLKHLELRKSNDGRFDMDAVIRLLDVPPPPPATNTIIASPTIISSPIRTRDTLEVLDLSDNGINDFEANRLLRSLARAGGDHYPRLHTVKLSQNLIFSWEVILEGEGLLQEERADAQQQQQQQQQQQPIISTSKLRTLVLDNNPCCRNRAGSLCVVMALWRVFPHLGSLGHGCMAALETTTSLEDLDASPILSLELATLFDWRRMGGELIVREDLPLSLWPTILALPCQDRYLLQEIQDERVRLERQATAIFGLLQGPACVGRSSFYFDRKVS
jgi:hypothetical protein